MSEKSDGGKPSEFFVGVVDLFSIILPGGVLTFALQRSLSDQETFKNVCGDLHDAAGWAAFLIASYILGHFIFAVGSLLLDDVYDTTYRVIAGESLDKLNAAVKGPLGFPPTGSGSSADHALEASKKSGNDLRPVWRRSDPIPGGSAVNWATAFVRTRNGAAAAEIDRAEADGKFFRSLLTLQILSWPLLFALSAAKTGLATPADWRIGYGLLALLLYAPRYRESGPFKEWWDDPDIKPVLSRVYAVLLAFVVLAVSWFPYSAIRSVVPLSVSYAVLGLTTWRFMEIRAKRTRLTYELALVLFKWPPGLPGSE
jgi:hypothetical protein